MRKVETSDKSRSASRDSSRSSGSSNKSSKGTPGSRGTSPHRDRGSSPNRQGGSSPRDRREHGQPISQRTGWVNKAETQRPRSGSAKSSSEGSERSTQSKVRYGSRKFCPQHDAGYCVRGDKCWLRHGMKDTRDLNSRRRPSSATPAGGAPKASPRPRQRSNRRNRRNK